MAPKEIIFSPSAEREIKKLSSDQQQKVLSALDKWSLGEGNPNVEKIKSQPNFYRIKAGDFRFVYYPLSQERVVLLMIRDRKNAYSDLGNLPEKLKTAFKKLSIAK